MDDVTNFLLLLEDVSALHDFPNFLNSILPSSVKNITWTTVETLNRLVTTCFDKVPHHVSTLSLDSIINIFVFIVTHSNSKDVFWSLHSNDWGKLSLKLLQLISEVTNSSYFLGRLLPFLKRVLQNMNGSRCAQDQLHAILSILVNEKHIFFSHLAFVMKRYADLLRNVHPSTLFNFALGRSHLITRLSKILIVQGDFELQMDLLEIILLQVLDRDGIIRRRWFPDLNSELNELFLNLSFMKFDSDGRKFLNAVNDSLKDHRSVISIGCSHVDVGGFPLKPPLDEFSSKGDLWIDLNLHSKRLGITCEDFHPQHHNMLQTIYVNNDRLFLLESSHLETNDIRFIFRVYGLKQLYGVAQSDDIICVASKIKNKNLYLFFDYFAQSTSGWLKYQKLEKFQVKTSLLDRSFSKLKTSTKKKVYVPLKVFKASDMKPKVSRVIEDLKTVSKIGQRLDKETETIAECDRENKVSGMDPTVVKIINAISDLQLKERKKSDMEEVVAENPGESGQICKTEVDSKEGRSSAPVQFQTEAQAQEFECFNSHENIVTGRTDKDVQNAQENGRGHKQALNMEKLQELAQEAIEVGEKCYSSHQVGDDLQEVLERSGRMKKSNSEDGDVDKARSEDEMSEFEDSSREEIKKTPDRSLFHEIEAKLNWEGYLAPEKIKRNPPFDAKENLPECCYERMRRRHMRERKKISKVRKNLALEFDWQKVVENSTGRKRKAVCSSSDSEGKLPRRGESPSSDEEEQATWKEAILRKSLSKKMKNFGFISNTVVEALKESTDLLCTQIQDGDRDLDLIADQVKCSILALESSIKGLNRSRLHLQNCLCYYKILSSKGFKNNDTFIENVRQSLRVLETPGVSAKLSLVSDVMEKLILQINENNTKYIRNMIVRKCQAFCANAHL